MRVHSLGSGSSGNAFLVDTGEIALLLDCGVGVRAVQAAVRDLNVADRLAGIVVSHEHIDHVRAVDSTIKRHGVPVVTTRGTYGAMRWTHAGVHQSSGERYADGSIELTFVGVSHDAAEPCGFVVDASGRRLAVFTDLGHAGPEVFDAIASADIVVLESNYDAGMLQRGPYPAHLKRRISGPNGHLSNDDCATILAATVSDRTRAIWLAHLSDKNNRPAIAEATAREALELVGQATPVRALPRFDRAELTAIPAMQLSFGM
jgi:phosphoribosyl 1,2-cyclic phosphodiesterase